jgi:hypothetical protein
MNICPVCGYPDLNEPAYDGTPGLHPGSLEICTCCGFQFGFHDDDRHITFEQWRNQWIAGGMHWDSGDSEPPPDWDPKKQLLNIDIMLP